MAKKYYLLLLAFVLIYLIASFAISPDPATLTRYHTDANHIRLVIIPIVIPLIAIWFAAFYGFISLGKYAAKIKNTPDGKGFALLTQGLLFLAVGLPVTTVVSSLLAYAKNHHTLAQSTITIINTHLAWVFPLIAFLFLLAGSMRLLKIVKGATVPASHDVMIGIGLAIISMLYVIATFKNTSRRTPVAPATTATYYLADWLILATIVLPYIFIWGCGLYASLRLRAYQQNVGGKLYKKPLGMLNNGVVAVVLTSIFLQFLTAMSTGLAGWQLGSLLALIYVLLAVIAIGYVLIALGAKELLKIEKIT